MGVCGPNEKYFEATLQEFQRLCDETVICLCNATNKERQLVKKYGFHLVEDNREWGKNQWQIKEDLLHNHVAKLDPDWVVALDMDEVFDSKFNREELDRLARRGGLGYYFYVVNLYDEGYSREWSFWNVRMFRWSPEHGMEYERKALHPGLAPKIAYFTGNYAPFLLKHYGLKDKEDRDRKASRYKQYDPKAVHKGKAYYDFLESSAPVTPFNEDELHQLVANEVKDYHFKQPIKMEQKERKFVYVKNPAGHVVDIPAEHLAETLSRPGFEFVSDDLPTTAIPEVQVNPLECGICGFVAKNKLGLNAHARKHQ